MDSGSFVIKLTGGGSQFHIGEMILFFSWMH